MNSLKQMKMNSSYYWSLHLDLSSHQTASPLKPSCVRRSTCSALSEVCHLHFGRSLNQSQTKSYRLSSSQGSTFSNHRREFLVPLVLSRIPPCFADVD